MLTNIGPAAIQMVADYLRAPKLEAGHNGSGRCGVASDSDHQ